VERYAEKIKEEIMRFHQYINEKQRPKLVKDYKGSTGKIDVDKLTKGMALSNVDKRTSKLVWIKTKPFDEAFKQDRNFYIGKGGSGNSIGDRYNQFKTLISMPDDERERYLNPMEQKEYKIAVSNVEVTDDGRVMFGNGRHRYAVLRDLGAKKIPVAMSSNSIKNAKKYNLLAI
jgi:hypothetical protein